MVILLTTQTVVLFFLIFSLTKTSWNRYLIFLIYLGGLLIIFVYLSALIPNEVFSTKETWTFRVISFFVTIRFIKYLTENFLDTAREYQTVETFSFNFLKNLVILIISYVVGGLLRSMSIIQKSKTPLKSCSYDKTKTQNSN